MKLFLKKVLIFTIIIEISLVIFFLSSSNSFKGIPPIVNFIEQEAQKNIEVKEIIKEEPNVIIYIPEQYSSYVKEICLENGIPLDIFAKLIQSESRWQPKAKRTNFVYIKKEKIFHSYDIGIAQLNSNNYEEFSWRFNDDKKIDPYNVEMSLLVSAKYLAWLYERTYSWYDVICAYKSGITKVREERVPEYIQVLSKAVIDPKISALDAEFFP